MTEQSKVRTEDGQLGDVESGSSQPQQLLRDARTEKEAGLR